MSGEDHGLAELLAARRAKLERLRAEGVEPFPHAFPAVESLASVARVHEALVPGEETAVAHRVAGRIAARREAGPHAPRRALAPGD
ncbi:MAG: hypothetical protein ABR946_09240 [Solirubrobacteraceae bacterium]